MKVILKALLSLLVLLVFFSHVTLIRLLFRRSQKRKNRVGAATSKYSKMLLRVFNCRISTKGSVPEGSFFIVCNHHSYLDIVILYSLFKQACFITAKDMEKRLFVGSIIKHGNAYGVERKSRNFIDQDVAQMKDILASGRSILLFPEGTTGNGDELLRFKYPLFQSCIQAQVPVLPICLNYIDIDGQPLNTKNRSSICWMRGHIVAHFIRFAKINKIEAEITFTPAINSTGKDPKELSLEARASVESVFKGAEQV